MTVIEEPFIAPATIPDWKEQEKTVVGRQFSYNGDPYQGFEVDAWTIFFLGIVHRSGVRCNAMFGIIC